MSFISENKLLFGIITVIVSAQWLYRLIKDKDYKRIFNTKTFGWFIGPTFGWFLSGIMGVIIGLIFIIKHFLE